MPSVQYLREFINERLTAAAEQIFLEFEKTIVQYEEEIDRQRRLLDITWKPQIKLHRTELPQQPVCKDEEVLPERQLWNQERNSLHQEEPELPHIKEEQEELCTSQEGEQVGLKEETDTFMVTAAEERDHHDPEANSNQLPSQTCPIDESQNHRGSRNLDSGTNSNLESQSNSDTGKESLTCNLCGKSFKNKYNMTRHQRIHTGEKPYSCETCGKKFGMSSILKGHLITHTGEKPYSCKICGKTYTRSSGVTVHMRMHTGERPYHCKTCRKVFSSSSHLSADRRIHTGERPYNCKTCGKMFKSSSHIWRHMKTHTGERPYHCKTCRKMFTSSSHLWRHMKTHTGDKS
ncbi:zinc finger protein 570-like [Oreochromis niloticus]|uniref:zinc finger protein 570-like n=1 Tax=Oreochromis niloticus TaxID=8128 RepID=UPI000904CC5E|nr:zinc finger protein 570-like [Oreochromis niloticus]XP_039458092.1 zinc finger protein 570-like [Oreochromis aureus]